MTAPAAYSAPLDLVTTAVLELLRGAELAVFDARYAEVPELVEDNAAYAADPLQPVFPYGVLYRIAGGSTDPFPSLGGNPLEVTVPYQVTTVSDLRNQCEAAGRRFRDRLLARDPDGGWLVPMAMPAGWRDIDRWPDDVLPGVDQSGQSPSAVFSLPFRFYITVAPT